MTRNERQLKATELEMERISREVKEVWDTAEAEDRDPSPEEKALVADRLKAVETLKGRKEELEDAVKVEQEVNARAGELKGEENSQKKEFPQPKRAPNWGEQFVQSEGYKALLARVKSGNGLPQNASTGPVELSFESKAGTLLEGGQGAGLIPVPQVIPGQVETLFQRVTIADVLPTGQATTNSLRYIVEGTATPGATAVAEGGDKPASDLALSTTDEPVQKIATILTVSDEMIEDTAQVQSYINGRLSLFVKIEEEDQLIRGDGSSPNISGFYDRSINVYGKGTVDNNAVALFKVINNTRGSSFLDVDHVFMHPTNWATTRLLQDANDQFYGGGPFTSAYGGAQGPSNDNRLAMDSIWNVPVTITTAVGAGTALVGSFRQGAQLWRRGGLTVEATNSHSDYFTKNLVAIRAEQREALAVYRPAAFTKVTGLD